jgi:hypothetical protein
LLPPRSNGGPEFFRFNYSLVRNHLITLTMRKAETAGMNLHSKCRPAVAVGVGLARRVGRLAVGGAARRTHMTGPTWQ